MIAPRRLSTRGRGVQLTEHEGGTRMELRSSFESREQMDQLMEMGAAEGMQQAVNQMDALLEGARHSS